MRKCGTGIQRELCETRRYAELLSSARACPHIVFQRFRLCKTPMRKPSFCGDFCEEARRHNITSKHATRQTTCAYRRYAEAIFLMPVFCSSQPHRPASPPMAFCSANAALFPPQANAAPFFSKNLPFPPVTDPAALPIRPERHVRNSITSIRVAIARAIACTLPRCPCCQRHIRRLNL